MARPPSGSPLEWRAPIAALRRVAERMLTQLRETCTTSPRRVVCPTPPFWHRLDAVIRPRLPSLSQEKPYWTSVLAVALMFCSRRDGLDRTARLMDWT